MRLWEVEVPKILRAGMARPTIGGDPEFFLATKRGKILNSDAILPHKDKPFYIGREGNLIKNEDDNELLPNVVGKLYFDGIQGELNFEYSNCRVICAQNIAKIMQCLFSIADGYKVVIKPSVRVRKEILDNAHPDARIFGCMPDFNAYTLTTNTCEMDASRHPFRYAGGHIHIGIPSVKYKKAKELLTEKGQLRMVKCLDILLNIPTLSMDNSNAAKLRRTKYGKAGCFRPTPYGVEYRSLSCWWLKSPITASLVFGLARVAYALAYHNKLSWLMKGLKIDEQDVEGCINESDTAFAKKLWPRLRAHLFNIGTSYVNPFSTQIGIGTLDYLVRHGVDHFLKPINEEWGNFRYSVINNLSVINGTYKRLADKNYRLGRYITKVWNTMK